MVCPMRVLVAAFSIAIASLAWYLCTRDATTLSFKDEDLKKEEKKGSSVWDSLIFTRDAFSGKYLWTHTRPVYQQLANSMRFGAKASSS
eukprot:gene13421-19276_t